MQPVGEGGSVWRAFRARHPGVDYLRFISSAITYSLLTTGSLFREAYTGRVQQLGLFYRKRPRYSMAVFPGAPALGLRVIAHAQIAPVAFARKL